MITTQATWEGTFTIRGVTIRCYIVDGQRIVNADDLAKLLDAIDTDGPNDELVAFCRWQAGLEAK